MLAYFKDVIVEMKKVVWPSPAQIFWGLQVMIVLIIVASLFFGWLDLGLLKLVYWIFGF